jgi:nucleoid-associated protein EbfC
MPKGTGGWGGPSRGGSGGSGGLDPRRAQDLQSKLMENLAKAQADLASASVEGSAGGGAIKVTMKGDQKVESISLAPEVVDPEDVEMLQDLLVVAFNDALEKVQGLQQQLMGSVTGGMKIPGLM